MDVREKLFTLFQDCNNPSWKWFPNNAEMLKLIDYLIAHGVTVQDNTEISDELLKQLKNAPITILQEEPTVEVVQEWIPLSEQKPDRDTLVLVFFDGMRETPAAIQVMYGWCIGGSASHWMPLPEPPKGE